MEIISNYTEARTRIESGDIIFFRGYKKQLSIQKLIMWSTNSHYVHVGIAFWAKIDKMTEPRLFIVEAQGGTRRRIVNLSFYSKYDFDVISPPKNWETISNEALENIGIAKYGYFDALWVGLREKVQIALNINLPLYNFHGETCSEFVSRIYNLENHIVSPQTLYELLIKHSCKQKFVFRAK